LQLMAHEIAPEETRELQEIFLAIDKNNEGTISFRDLKDAIRGNGAPRSPTRRRKSGGGLVDSIPTPCMAGSPRISMLGARSPRPASLAGEGSPTSPKTPAGTLRRANSGMLDELVHMLDANGDERIYYSDFLAATMQCRSRLREEAVRATFNRFDADRSGTISVSDVRNVLGDSFEGMHVEDLVAQADPKGKGEISFEDFLRVVEDQDVTSAATPRATPRATGKPRLSSGSPTKRLSFFPEVEETANGPSLGGC